MTDATGPLVFRNSLYATSQTDGATQDAVAESLDATGALARLLLGSQ